MTYYKIIQNGTVIEVGKSFFRWNLMYHRMFYCDVDHGEFVVSIDGNRFYRDDDWMVIPPEEATGYETAKVTIIDENEYADLYSQLVQNEVVLDNTDDMPEEVLPVVDISENTEDNEMVISLYDMRRLLLAQQKQIEELTNLLNAKTNE